MNHTLLLSPTCIKRSLKWPSRSPDLTPCDFFLWTSKPTNIKTQVYSAPMNKLCELRDRIENTFQQMPQAMVDRVIDSYDRRLRKCEKLNGGHVEAY
uniref:Uncharacterized protein n=1 Tax=Ditylenchus dipsaci TaxID=166011 RepID=A0A915DS48_9BILA